MSGGTLYVVGTPIGNLSDVTHRALEVLRSVSVVYAEDTRVSRKLLNRYEIGTPMRSYREAAEPRLLERMLAEMVLKLGEGHSIAYVSDAGTPGISDPGSYLVQRVVAEGFDVVPIPGVSALAAILSVAGMPIQHPLFVGFLPKKKGRQTLLARLKSGLDSAYFDAIVLYESPERIVRTLDELAAWELPIQVCLGRELTKQFEEVLRGTIAEVRDLLASRKTIKGEITLIIAVS